MVADSLFKFAHEIFCLAECEIGVDTLLEGEEAALLEPVGFPGRERLKEEIGERRPLPDRQRRGERARRRSAFAAPRERPAPLEERFEAVEVKLLRFDVHEVSGRSPFDSL